MLSGCLAVGSAWSAETSLIGGAAINYKLDDNVQVSEIDQLALSGWILSGFLKGQYATPRLTTSADLKLEFERYDRASLDSNNANLADPDPEDFDSENQDLKASIGYDWERQTLSLFGRYWRDSVLNTQFLDTGLGGPRELDGASRRTDFTLRPAWKWQVTERQLLDVSLVGQKVDYQDDRYVDFDYASLNFGWSYMLTERVSLQLQPYFSWYDNKADLAVTSRTFGLQGGFAWALSEKWQLDMLAGGTRVYTEYGDGGRVIIDPDSGQEAVIEDQDSNSFIGTSTLRYTDECFGFNVNVSANTSPSGNGVLRQQNRGRAVLYWVPAERMRIDFDGVLGRDSATDDRIDNGRDYSEAGMRFAYQFLSRWWFSAQYRFREQQYDFQESQGRGNSLFFALSYRLPKEIL
jgi:hypothetical protein